MLTKFETYVIIISKVDYKIKRYFSFLSLTIFLKDCQTFSQEKFMSFFERQNKILSFLKQKQFSTVKELSKEIYSSESSVRRDLKILEANGLVKQVYGGVVLPEYAKSVVPIKLRDNYNSTIKEQLAKQASKYFFDGATVIMDGSSTVRRIIKYLNTYRNIKIITNNLHIINECVSPEITIYCTGGRFLSKSNIFVGSTAENFLKTINADLLFFSSQAISNDGEITDISEDETALRQVMLSRAKKKYFLCDSSKIGLKQTFSVCTKDDLDDIICDAKLPWQ